MNIAGMVTGESCMSLCAQNTSIHIIASSYVAISFYCLRFSKSVSCMRLPMKSCIKLLV